MKDLEMIRDAAIEAAREAGSYARFRCGDLKDVSHKQGHSDLVTDVDTSCEKMIIDRIKETFPLHSILAEESGKDDGEKEFCWIIDPIDGTVNYAHGFPFYCTSIGVLHEGRVKVGVVYDPERDELFAAVESRGAFLNGSRIKVSQVDKVRDAMVATGFAYQVSGKMRTIPFFKLMLREAQAVRRAGSAALDLCYVACGRFDGFWEFGLNPWDTAAGQLILKEAGGLVSKADGADFDIFEGQIAASNGKIHREILTLLGSCSAEEL